MKRSGWHSGLYAQPLGCDKQPLGVTRPPAGVGGGDGRPNERPVTDQSDSQKK